MKIVGINVNLEITVLKEALVIKDFSNDSYIVYSWFPRREVTVFFKLMRK